MIASDLTGSEEAPPLHPDAYLAPGYRVRRHLGRAYPYDVYEAWSEERRCRCVVKTPSPAAAPLQEVPAGLLREGETLLALAHPHLIRAYDVVGVDHPVLVLEAPEGLTIDRLLDEIARPLAVAELTRLAAHLSSALAYLHGKGLLHLGLRPSTVAIADTGRAMIVDLSTARPTGLGGTSEGDPGYCAPEQASGAPPTTATDVWGIGIILYEAATRLTPFPDSRHGAYQQLARRLVLSDEHRRRLPAQLAALIEACVDQVASARPYPDEVTAWCELIG